MKKNEQDQPKFELIIDKEYMVPFLENFEATLTAEQWNNLFYEICDRMDGLLYEATEAVLNDRK